MKKKLVYLLSLWPIIDALILLFMISIDVEAGVMLRPIYEFSIIGLLVFLLSVFATGLCGYLFGKCNQKMWVSALAGNAIPIICTVVYIVGMIAKATEEPIIMMMGLFGNGMASVISIFISALQTTVLEVPIALLLKIAIFVVGYALSSVNLKNL